MASKGRKGRLSAIQECDAIGAAGFEGRCPESLPRQGNFDQSGIPSPGSNKLMFNNHQYLGYFFLLGIGPKFA